jgi:hypothetical protein
MSPRALPTLAALLFAAVLASACSSDTSEPRAADASTPAANTVLRFTAPRLGGGTIEGEDFAGRDVAFWFWAPW